MVAQKGFGAPCAVIIWDSKVEKKKYSFVIFPSVLKMGIRNKWGKDFDFLLANKKPNRKNPVHVEVLFARVFP